jgi:GxxExxY protein
MQTIYKNEHIGARWGDFLIEDVISMGIKALTGFEGVHFTEAIKYLETYKLAIGLLINFGTKSLMYRRLINPKFNKYNQLNHTDQLSSAVRTFFYY